MPEVSFPCRYTEALVRTNNIVTRVLFTIPALFLSVPNTLEKSRKFLKNKILLDATCYFIMLVLGSTCFGHHYAHHQELTTIALVTTYAVWFWRCCWLGVKCRQNGWVSGPKAVTRLSYNLRSWRSSILPAINLQPAATREPDGVCGNQRYRRELLMMGIMVPETCVA